MDTTQSRIIKVRRESDNKEMIVNLDDDNSIQELKAFADGEDCYISSYLKK